jgi:uncharacterized protein GlcG (DUF336 family)
MYTPRRHRLRSPDRLSLDAANSVVSAAIAHANPVGVQELIVVDDRDGFPIAMARMDNELLTSINIAGQGVHGTRLLKWPDRHLSHSHRDTIVVRGVFPTDDKASAAGRLSLAGKRKEV